jgi:hypothetical protein
VSWSMSICQYFQKIAPFELFLLFPTVSFCFLRIILNVILVCRTYFIWQSGYFTLYFPLKLYYLFLFWIVLTYPSCAVWLEYIS